MDIKLEAAALPDLEGSGRHLYVAGCARHQARQGHVDRWIVAAVHELPKAISEDLAATERAR